MKKKASTLLMIRPVSFGYNVQTADSNSFQNKIVSQSNQEIQANALEEFNMLVTKLKRHKIDVAVFEDTPLPHTPDSIFPNNWISFHENNSIILYPMLALNRRQERRTDIINYFKKEKNKLINITKKENENIFLEGTGSIIFDYENKNAYANISPRTNKALFKNVCEQLNYTPISFKAVDQNKQDIYHTNVIMCIGNTFAVLCSDSIPDKKELKTITDSLEKTNHEVIDISYLQMNSFAGNMYQLFNEEEKSFILMSEQAFKSLTAKQIKTLEKHGSLIHSPLYTIEKHGGGSARCMIADVRL